MVVLVSDGRVDPPDVIGGGSCWANGEPPDGPDDDNGGCDIGAELGGLLKMHKYCCRKTAFC